MLSPFRTNVVRQIWLLALEMGVSLLPVEYVNTKDNDVADLESRELDPDDWIISDCAWEQMEIAFGPHGDSWGETTSLWLSVWAPSDSPCAPVQLTGCV